MASVLGAVWVARSAGVAVDNPFGIVPGCGQRARSCAHLHLFLGMVKGRPSAEALQVLVHIRPNLSIGPWRVVGAAELVPQIAKLPRFLGGPVFIFDFLKVLNGVSEDLPLGSLSGLPCR